MGMVKNKDIGAFGICGFAYHVALMPEEQPDVKNKPCHGGGFLKT